MTLQHFEEYISDTIVQRGWSYYVNDHVASPQRWTDTRYEFLVTGTQPYQVRIELMQNQVLETSCTCPYDQEVICKHVAAALFYLRETRTSPGHTEQPPARVKLQELLQQVSKDQLQTFILNKAERDTLFREEFLMTFARVRAKNAKTHYRQHLRQLIERAAGPGGFVDWYHARDLSEGVDVILAQGQAAIEKYYQILKRYVPDKQWPSFVEQVVQEMNAQGYVPADPLAKIFIQEEQWLRLLAFLQSKNDLVMITRYEKYLPDEYADTIVMMYRKAILQYMADHTGRDHYRQVVQHLQRMLALGGYTQVAEVIEVLTQKYPRRTALREELGRLQMD